MILNKKKSFANSANLKAKIDSSSIYYKEKIQFKTN